MRYLNFPKEIMIEATNICNCHCFFCSSTVTDRAKGVIDPQLATRLIGRAYDLGARKISFHCMGEPFLCPDLSKYVDLSKKLGYEYIYLDTNGIAATPERLNPVLDAGLDSLKFSIHAATAETHRRITNTSGFENVVSNLKSGKKYIEEKGLHCKLIAYFAVSTVNVHEVEQFTDMFKPIVDEVWIKSIHNGSGANEKNKEYIVRNQQVQGVCPKIPCAELYNRMIIDWRGRGIACCTDWTESLVYGDAKKEDLLALWNNDRIWSIRKQHERYDTLPDICAKCLRGL